jgi:DNA-binding IclR family transcriptional regulator
MAIKPNKTKIAKRVLEVLEFFDENTRQATCMDIARRYGRPQSSTSELLSSLTEMGFLYKDSRSRSYSPTPRVALLGCLAQPDTLKSGRLLPMMNRLSAKTGCGVALAGVVGTHAQLFGWVAGPETRTDFCSGASDALSAGVAGQLLLSTLPKEQCAGLLRRLNAEAEPERRFSSGAMLEQVETFGRQGYAIGPSGFAAGMDMCAALLPHQPGERPLALAVVFAPERRLDPDVLLDRLLAAVSDFAAEGRVPPAPVASNDGWAPNHGVAAAG